MSSRARKFIGTLLLLLLVAAWSFLALAVAEFPVFAGRTGLQLVYYVVAGMGWLVPAMPLVKWMLTGGR